MKPKLIKTAAAYEASLARIEHIFEAKPNTPEGDELDSLTALVEVYERAAYPIELPSAVEAIKFRMSQQGLLSKDMVPYLGSTSNVSAVLSGKRPLSLTMIRNLVSGLGLSADVLAQPPKPVAPS